MSSMSTSQLSYGNVLATSVSPLVYYDYTTDSGLYPSYNKWKVEMARSLGLTVDDLPSFIEGENVEWDIGAWYRLIKQRGRNRLYMTKPEDLKVNYNAKFNTPPEFSWFFVKSIDVFIHDQDYNGLGRNVTSTSPIIMTSPYSETTDRYWGAGGGVIAYPKWTGPVNQEVAHWYDTVLPNGEVITLQQLIVQGLALKNGTFESFNKTKQQSDLFLQNLTRSRFRNHQSGSSQKAGDGVIASGMNANLGYRKEIRIPNGYTPVTYSNSMLKGTYLYGKTLNDTMFATAKDDFLTALTNPTGIIPGLARDNGTLMDQLKENNKTGYGLSLSIPYNTIAKNKYVQFEQHIPQPPNAVYEISEYKKSNEKYNTALKLSSLLQFIIDFAIAVLLPPYRRALLMRVLTKGPDVLFETFNETYHLQDMANNYDGLTVLNASARRGDVYSKYESLPNSPFFKTGATETVNVPTRKVSLLEDTTAVTQRTSPFMTVPINQLFKSVDEFESYLKDLVPGLFNIETTGNYTGIDSESQHYFTANIQPYMDFDSSVDYGIMYRRYGLYGVNKIASYEWFGYELPHMPPDK